MLVKKAIMPERLFLYGKEMPYGLQVYSSQNSKGDTPCLSGRNPYIEKRRRQAILITESGKTVFYCNMDFLKQYVDERFLDCHRSYLFNMDKILRMADQTVYMEGGFRVFLGRECFRRGRKIFGEYIK